MRFMSSDMRVAGLILAGGKSRRMGDAEKGFLILRGVPVMTRIVRTISSQCVRTAISAQGNLSRFDAYRADLIRDRKSQGPFVALVDGLDWFSQNHPSITHVLSAPSDTPFLPSDLKARLAAALGDGAFCACARSGGQSHPIIGLWPIDARKKLHQAVVNDVRSFSRALEDEQVAQVEWGAVRFDPFFNLNTPEDFAIAEAMADHEKMS